MRFYNILSLFLSAFLLCFLEVNAEKPDIEGHWKSVSSEDFHDGTFGTRIYKFENTSWSETLIVYGDRNLSKPLFKVRYEGYFDITKDHPGMYKTYFINFHFSKKTLTLLTDNKETIKLLGFKSCNPKKDEEIDISERGCSFLLGIKDFPVLYDIVKKDMDLLFLGIHSYKDNLDQSDERPNYFHYPLRKYNPKKESEWVKDAKTVYALMDFNIKDEDGFNEFMDGYVESMHKYGGISLAYSNDIRSFQGETSGRNLIIQIWPDEQQFERWWNSRDFKSWKTILLRSTDVNVSLSKRYTPIGE